MSKINNIVIDNLEFRSEVIADYWFSPPSYEDAVLEGEGEEANPGPRAHSDLVDRVVDLLNDIKELNKKSELNKRICMTIDSRETSVDVEFLPLNEDYRWEGFKSDKYSKDDNLNKLKDFMTNDAQTLVTNLFYRCCTLKDIGNTCYYDDDLAEILENLKSLMGYMSRWGGILFIYQDKDLKWKVKVVFQDCYGYLPVVML